jgi:hypothetical protein
LAAAGLTAIETAFAAIAASAASAAMTPTAKTATVFAMFAWTGLTIVLSRRARLGAVGFAETAAAAATAVTTATAAIIRTFARQIRIGFGRRGRRFFIYRLLRKKAFQPSEKAGFFRFCGRTGNRRRSVRGARFARLPWFAWLAWFTRLTGFARLARFAKIAPAFAAARFERTIAVAPLAAFTPFWTKHRALGARRFP